MHATTIVILFILDLSFSRKDINDEAGLLKVPAESYLKATLHPQRLLDCLRALNPVEGLCQKGCHRIGEGASVLGFDHGQGLLAYQAAI